MGIPTPLPRSRLGARRPLGLVGPAPRARLSAVVGVAETESRALIVHALEAAAFTVVAETSRGPEALDVIRARHPDAAVLDADLPGLSGFDVLAGLPPSDRPPCVFVTADALDAARAFEADAADCIVKPLHAERIAVAASRLRRRRAGGAAARSGRLEDWLLVKRDGRSVFVRVADIDWIESARNNVLLHVGAERFLHHETTTGIEARLSPDKFLRIHRSAIVRIDRIRDLQPWFNGDYRVTLKDGTELTLSETYRSRLKRFRV